MVGLKLVVSVLGVMENKSWRDLRLIGINGLLGTITAHASVTGSNAPSTWDAVVSVDSNTTDANGKLNAAAPLPTPDLWVAFHLQSNPECSCSARMIGYQVRAVPSPRRNELIQIPVRMFDYEKDRQGSSYGRVNGAYDRFVALKRWRILVTRLCSVTTLQVNSLKCMWSR
jgi:hypothetical protein